MPSPKYPRTIRTKEQVASWAERIASGERMTAIAKEAGVSRQRVWECLVRDGYRTTPPPKAHGPKTCPVCFAPYEHGRYREHVETAGHPYSSHVRRHDPRAVVEAYQSGERLIDISRRLAMDYPTIYRLLRAGGIEPNRGGRGHYVRTEETRRRYRETKAAKRLGLKVESNKAGGWRA